MSSSWIPSLKVLLVKSCGDNLGNCSQPVFQISYPMCVFQLEKRILFMDYVYSKFSSEAATKIQEYSSPLIIILSVFL